MARTNDASDDGVCAHESMREWIEALILSGRHRLRYLLRLRVLSIQTARTWSDILPEYNEAAAALMSSSSAGDGFSFSLRYADVNEGVSAALR